MIVVRPNELRSTAKNMREHAKRIQAAIRNVDEVMRLPSSVISGHQAEELRRRYQARRQYLQGFHNRILYFAVQLEQVADRLEAADRKLTSDNSNISRRVSEGFWSIVTHLLKGGAGIGGKFLDMLHDFTTGRLAFKKEMIEWGFGDFYKYLSKGIPYRGEMDKFLKSGWLKGGLLIASTLIDTFEDINKGIPVPESIGVNVINGLETYGIATNPYGAAALLINSGIQIFGDLETGAQEILADVISPDQATHDLLMKGTEKFAQSVDQMDLENVTKEIGRTIYNVYAADYVDVGTNTFNQLKQWATQDGSINGLSNTLNAINQYNYQVLPPQEMILKSVSLTNPAIMYAIDPRMAEGTQKTLNAVGEFFTGAWNTVVTSTTTGSMYRAAISDRLVDLIPGLPEGFRAALHHNAQEGLRQIAQATDVLTF